MENKLGVFFEQLKVPSDFQVLFQNENDCKLFFEDFYLRNKYIVDDLLDFREYKISKSKITVDSFKELCYNSKVGLRKAFEQTFLQSFTDQDLEKISEAIVGGKLPLKKLISDFQKNPNKNILKNVL